MATASLLKPAVAYLFIIRSPVYPYIQERNIYPSKKTIHSNFNQKTTDQNHVEFLNCKTFNVIHIPKLPGKRFFKKST